MEISPTLTMEPLRLDSREDILALVIINWLADRSRMELFNTPKIVAMLQGIEVKELEDAIKLKKEGSLEFDDTPGELADIVFFGLTFLRQLGLSQEALVAILKTKPAFLTSVENIKELSSWLQELPEDENPKNLENDAILILLHTLALGKTMGYDLIQETLEKAAFNHTRYLARSFELSKRDKKALEILEDPLATSVQKEQANLRLKNSFIRAKAYTRTTTTNLRLKEAFYEILPKQPKEKKHRRRLILSRQKLAELTTQFTGFLLGLGV